VSTDLATKNATGTLVIRNMDDLARLGNMLASSGYFTDARDAAQAGVKVLAGLEMGIGAFAAMAGVYVIKGKPSVGAGLMAAAVKRHPRYNYKVRRLDSTGCEIEFFEDGESVGVSSFTEADAKAANLLGNDNYKRNPRNMYFARSLSNGVRWYAPDVFDMSTYTPEELGASVDDDGNVIDIEPSPVRHEKPAAPALEAPAAEPEPEAAQEAPEPAEDAPPAATGPQLRKLAVAIKEQGLARDDALGFFSWLAGRKLESSKELTKAEASRALDWDTDQWSNALADYAVALEGGPFNEEQDNA
jgi:hypothetical protein